jgi:hypothetical protein
MNLMMPENIKGAMLGEHPYVKTLPRQWTDEEIKWCSNAYNEGFTYQEIADAAGRSKVSVSTKLKRLGKSDNKYNVKHRELKYLANESFLAVTNPSSVLDLYAGDSWWKPRVDRCVTNDIDTSYNTDLNDKAFDVLLRMNLDKTRFDVIDLDPFGSAHECFDLALRLANKGIVVSFGEWGHRRFNRFDFVKNRYGIYSMNDFVESKFVEEFQRMAAIHKKKATVFDSLKYGHFFRVYFLLETFKETSQWDKEGTQ